MKVIVVVVPRVEELQYDWCEPCLPKSFRDEVPPKHGIRAVLPAVQVIEVSVQIRPRVVPSICEHEERQGDEDACLPASGSCWLMYGGNPVSVHPHPRYALPPDAISRDAPGRQLERPQVERPQGIRQAGFAVEIGCGTHQAVG